MTNKLDYSNKEATRKAQKSRARRARRPAFGQLIDPSPPRATTRDDHKWSLVCQITTPQIFQLAAAMSGDSERAKYRPADRVDGVGRDPRRDVALSRKVAAIHAVEPRGAPTQCSSVPRARCARPPSRGLANLKQIPASASWSKSRDASRRAGLLIYLAGPGHP